MVLQMGLWNGKEGYGGGWGGWGYVFQKVLTKLKYSLIMRTFVIAKYPQVVDLSSWLRGEVRDDQN